MYFIGLLTYLETTSKIFKIQISIYNIVKTYLKVSLTREEEKEEKKMSRKRRNKTKNTRSKNSIF